MDHHGASIRRCRGFHSSYKGQQSSGMIGHPVLRPGCEVELTHLMLGRVSSLATETQNVHIKTQNICVLTTVACRPLFRPGCPSIHSEKFPSVREIFQFSMRATRTLFTLGIRIFLKQLGLRASHASSSCRVTDTQKGITDALWELREGWEVSTLYWEAAAVTQQFLPLYRDDSDAKQRFVEDRNPKKNGKSYEKQAVTSSQIHADLNKQQRVPMENKCDSVMIMLCLCHCHSRTALSPSDERSPGRLTGWRP